MHPTSDTSLASAVFIEIGSNQVWIIVGHYQHQKLHITHETSATLRLGGRLTPDKELPAAAWALLQEQLEDWRPLWQSCPPQQRLVVSTQVLREAHNQAAWVNALRNLLECEVRVIDGKQEAAWGYAGAILRQPMADPQPCLVLDIGGRSTEISHGTGPQWHDGQSFAVGAVSWSQRYFAHGWQIAAFEQAMADARAQFTALQSAEWQQRWTHVYGVAGVAQALTHVLQSLGHPAHNVSLAAMQQLQMQLCTLGTPWLHTQCSLLPGLEPMLGGCISTMQALMQTLNISNLQVTTGGLRHGALQALLTKTSILAQQGL